MDYENRSRVGRKQIEIHATAVGSQYITHDLKLVNYFDPTLKTSCAVVLFLID